MSRRAPSLLRTPTWPTSVPRPPVERKTGANGQFMNYWNANINLQTSLAGTVDDRLTRGGPAILSPDLDLTTGFVRAGRAGAIYIGMHPAEGKPVTLLDAIWAASFIGFPTAGAIVVSRLPRRPLGWMLLVAPLIIMVGLFLSEVSGMLPDPDRQRQVRAALEQARRDLTRLESLQGVVAEKDVQQAALAVRTAEERANAALSPGGPQRASWSGWWMPNVLPSGSR